LFIMAHLL